MKRFVIPILLIALAPSAPAGLIFDNGIGDKNDSLVIQFCLLDSAGARYTTWDTAYVVQAYRGEFFNIDTLLSPSNYSVDSLYPGNLLFEYLLPAVNPDSSIGAYTWWVFLVDSNNGTDTHHIHKGSYYVNTDPIEDLLAISDIDTEGALSPLLKIDPISSSVGKPSDSTGSSLHRKLGPYSGGDDNIKNAIDALSLTGGGTEACTLFVKQDSTAAIQSARIVIRTLDQSATKVPGLFTDVNGTGIAELDPASYFISITANNYVPLVDTFVVSQDATWLFNMDPYDPGNPPAPDLCRVYGWVYDIGGENLADVTVSAEIPSDYQPVKYGDIIITPFKKSTCSDSTGYWEIDLFPNGVLSQPDSKYQFVIEYPSGVILKSQVAVPDLSSWQFR